MSMSSLTLFKAQRAAIWSQVFEDSENAIQSIVQSLAWNDSVYRTFNEGLRLSKGSDRATKLPKSLVDYIHQAHVAYVVITLRKLYDDKKEGSRAVNSLRSVTQRIVDNQHLFTRENYLQHDGTPYESSDRSGWRTNATVDGRHKQFDLLSGVTAASKRRRTDKVDPSIALQLHRQTELRAEIDRFANKFLAHSAASNNRPDEDATFKELTLLRIQSQYRRAIWSCQQIGRFLMEPILTEVPVPQFDVLEQWEKGLFDDRTKRLLSSYWLKRMAWWRKWTQYYWDSDRLFLSPGQ
jgi:hypothetical protein